jgi:O-antigen/teichoic acid export membrane protein
MLVIIVSLPLALQTDRIVLSHVSTLRAVANYSVVIQIFAPIVGLVTAASAPLWPMYAKARRDGVPGPNLLRISLLFATAATIIGAALVALANPLGHVIGGPTMRVGLLLPIAAALTVVVQALIAPVAMMLTDPAGLRVIATWNVIAIPVNLGISIVLAKHIGAPGPLLATAGTILIVQGIPTSLYARRRNARLRAGIAASGPAPRPRRRRRQPGRHRLAATR